MNPLVNTMSDWKIVLPKDIEGKTPDVCLSYLRQNLGENPIVGLDDLAYPMDVEEARDYLLQGMILVSIHSTRRRKGKGGRHWIVLTRGKSDWGGKTISESLEYHDHMHQIWTFWVEEKDDVKLVVRIPCGHEMVREINAKQTRLVCGHYDKAHTNQEKKRCLQKMISLDDVMNLCLTRNLLDEYKEMQKLFKRFASKTYQRGATSHPGKRAMTWCPDPRCGEEFQLLPKKRVPFGNHLADPIMFFSANTAYEWTHNDHVPTMWSCSDPKKICGGKTWCVTCTWEGYNATPYHIGKTCDTYQRECAADKIQFSAEELQEMRGLNIRVCPNNLCKALIQKIDGCDKMQCRLCATKFCFVCGEKTPTYAHYNDDRRIGTYGCPKRASADERDAAIVEEKEDAGVGAAAGGGAGADAGAGVGAADAGVGAEAEAAGGAVGYIVEEMAGLVIGAAGGAAAAGVGAAVGAAADAGERVGAAVGADVGADAAGGAEDMAIAVEEMAGAVGAAAGYIAVRAAAAENNEVQAVAAAVAAAAAAIPEDMAVVGAVARARAVPEDIVAAQEQRLLMMIQLLHNVAPDQVNDMMDDLMNNDRDVAADAIRFFFER